MNEVILFLTADHSTNQCSLAAEAAQLEASMAMLAGGALALGIVIGIVIAKLWKGGRYA